MLKLYDWIRKESKKNIKKGNKKPNPWSNHTRHENGGEISAGDVVRCACS